MPVVAGALVVGRFRLERELGRGGMGSVWRAHQVALDTPCALKFIDAKAAEAAELRARFEREAKAAAQLRSPNVVQILDHGVWEGRPYIAMELLEGEDLGKRLERVGRLGADETVGIVSQVARALTKAHAAGIVHRDLKPDNVFLVEDDDREVAKVLDFGIAKTSSPKLEQGMEKTRTGALLGTPYYMSPEQAKGIGAIDWRSDLWSLAVIAFECVTGRRPFESEALGDLLSKIMHDPIPTASSVYPEAPPAFDAWWARASARPVAERFQSARELADALADAVDLESASRAERVGAPRTTPPPSELGVVKASTPLGTAVPMTPRTAKKALAETVPVLVSPEGSQGGSAPTFSGQSTGAELTRPRGGERRTVVWAVGSVVAMGVLLLVFQLTRPTTKPPPDAPADAPTMREPHKPPATAPAPAGEGAPTIDVSPGGAATTGLFPADPSKAGEPSKPPPQSSAASAPTARPGAPAPSASPRVPTRAYAAPAPPTPTASAAAKPSKPASPTID